MDLLLAVLTILAIIIGPIVALRLQERRDRSRDKQNRKLVIFKDLMATRASRSSVRHVDALNAIEIEFSAGVKADKSVLEASRLYLDHLMDPTSVVDETWHEKAHGLLIDLLYAMSRALEYDFDRVDLKKVYSPKGHFEAEVDQYLLRKYFVEIMEGKRDIPVGTATGGAPLKVKLEEGADASPAMPALGGLLGDLPKR
ncbi:MAG: hypothetical protein F4Y47_07895 [Acidobacteriia bacterium]|nr:hypothetical protein [Terriglobia bacterium]MYK08952.1 hypothetical protein [Terriglobia bacterium]